MSQKLPVNDFKWVEDISKFGENFIKGYNEGNDAGNFLEFGIQCLKTLQNLHNDLPFLPERAKTEKVEKLVDETSCMIKLNMLYT